MTKSDPRFDWNGWLATIPGIPADWGQQRPAMAATPLVRRVDRRPQRPALPERAAA